MDSAAEVRDPSPRNAAEENMAKAGIPLTERVQEDYFGFDETHIVPLPDGVSFVEHKSLNEGARRRYINSTNTEIVLRNQSKDAAVKTAPGTERTELLKAAISGWNLIHAGVPVPFNTINLNKFLDEANPRIIEIIEKDIRKKNSWLLQDMSVEDIDREMANLQELRDAKVAEEEAGNDSKTS